MLKVASTENRTGILLSGNWEDLNALYDAISNLLGEEGFYKGYDDVSTRILGLSYELRHAYQGDRETFSSEDGTPCYATRLLWPEVLFDTYALCDYVTLAKGKKSYLRAEIPDLNEEVRRHFAERLDTDIALIRFFQCLVWAELKKVIGEKRYKKLPEYFELHSFFGAATGDFKNYCLPYLDMLNVKYLRTKPERRESFLATTAGRIISMDAEYQQIKKEIEAYAVENDIPVTEVSIGNYDYPEEIVW